MDFKLARSYRPPPASVAAVQGAVFPPATSQEGKKMIASFASGSITNRNSGAEFVTTSGAVEHSLLSIKIEVMFTLTCGTPNQCKASIHATIVDTSAYDASLGMEFITAMGGAYDTWTELFKYRWLGENGFQSQERPELCHTRTILHDQRILHRPDQQRSGALRCSGCP